MNRLVTFLIATTLLGSFAFATLSRAAQFV